MLAFGYTASTMLASIIFLGWFVVCLGAFRAVHGVSRLRSAVAAAIAVLAFWPYSAFLTLLLLGMFGVQGPPLH